MKNRFVILIGSFLIFLVSYFLFQHIFNLYEKSLDVTIRSSQVDSLYQEYQKKLDSIQNNINVIIDSHSQELSVLNSKFNSDETKYIEYLVPRIKLCYSYYSDSGISYTNSLKIIDYKDEEVISKGDLKVLNQQMKSGEDYCFNLFFNYEKQLNNFDENQRITMSIPMNPIMIFSSFLSTSDDVEFIYLLDWEYAKVSLIENLTVWLRQFVTR